MITLINIIWIYLAFLVVVILHEFGHRPTLGIKVVRWFPLPEMASMSSYYRLGGLVVNFLILWAVFYFKPETFFLQLAGLVSWLHFITYVIFGSFNKELSEKVIKNHPSLLRTYVFDDVPNESWWFFVSAGIITFYLFKAYYLPILLGLFA